MSLDTLSQASDIWLFHLVSRVSVLPLTLGLYSSSVRSNLLTIYVGLSGDEANVLSTALLCLLSKSDLAVLSLDSIINTPAGMVLKPPVVCNASWFITFCICCS